MSGISYITEVKVLYTEHNFKLNFKGKSWKTEVCVEH